jgi:hypothetical protein
MKGRRILHASVVAMIAAGIAAAAPAENVPLYTGEDLERMFGPAPPRPSDPVDKSGPGDWRFVEQFLDRQYSRIDADRSYDFDKRALDIASRRVAPFAQGYYGGVAWGLGYPASTWWQGVWSGYANGSSASSWHGRHAAFTASSREPSRHRHGR